MTSRFLLFLRLLWERLAHGQVLVRASGLAYTSLLATVPLIAVLFSLVSAFDVFDELEARTREFLFSRFLPTHHDEIVGYIDQFTAGAGQLGFFGFLFLVASAVLLLDSIETTFNETWHVHRRRRLVSRLTAFSGVLIFGTVFLGASLTVSSRLVSLLASARPLAARGPLRQLADATLPFVLSVAGFLVLYLVVPYTRVRWPSAALGAVLGGGLWEVAKSVFASTVGQAVSYSTIYGSLAVFPIFLVWLYVTWILVLLGLEVAYIHQHFATLARERERARGGEPRTGPVVVALEIFAEVARRFHRGEAPPTAEELSHRCLEPAERIEEMVERLLEAGLLQPAAPGDAGLVPARPLERIQLADVAGVFLAGVTPAGDPVRRRLADTASAFLDAGRDALGDTTFADLVAADVRPPAAETGDDVRRRTGAPSGDAAQDPNVSRKPEKPST